MPAPIVHEGLAILRVSEPAVLDEVAAAIDLTDFVIGRLSDCELIIDPARLGQLSNLLAERGLPPLVRKSRQGAGDEWEDPDVTRPVGRDPSR